jgi:formimidoylglutamate deiminase
VRLVFEKALVESAVVRGVAVEIGEDGTITSVGPATAADAGKVIAGLALPGMPNLHSHAFQRAMAGTAETAGAGADSFWTWRDAMYRFVDRLTPEDVAAIGAYVYLEMLKAGYTSVAEFHYVHHQADGQIYADPATLSRALRQAAGSVGIRQLLLPSLYQTAGFGNLPPRHAQRRFVQSTDQFLRLYASLCEDETPGFTTGIALHSLRAVPLETLREVVGAVTRIDPHGPIHVHVAEQRQEVVDCVNATGRRPVELLLDTGLLDDRWCLVHATHVLGHELDGIVRSGAVVGLCLTTEGNLGDGRFPLDELHAAGGRFGVGSDSQVSVDPREELRLAEYNLRLWRERRVVVRDPATVHSGTLLYRAAAAGGARALGRPGGGLQVGADADIVVLDASLPAFAGVADEALVDQYVFAPRPGVVRDVLVAGQWQVRGGRHAGESAIEAAYVRSLERLRA